MNSEIMNDITDMNDKAAPLKIRGRLWSAVTLGGWLLMAGVTAAPGEAQGAIFPAQFGNGPDSITSLVRCPDMLMKRDRNVMVFCQIQVNADGSTQDGRTFCFGNTDSPPAYELAGARAARDATFQPAIMDDQPVDVMFNFRLLFVHKGGGCRVAAVPNPGFQSGELGMAYYAPQEIVSKTSWIRQSGIGRKGGTRRLEIEQRGMMFLLSINVDARGTALGGEIVRNNFGTRQEAKSGLRAARKARYIPGFVAGKPTLMKYFGFMYFNAGTQPASFRSFPDADSFVLPNCQTAGR